MSADWVTSMRTKRASPPFCLMSATVFSPPAPSRSPMTTLAPSRPEAKAVACPMPEAPPVIRMTLPLRKELTICLLVDRVIGTGERDKDHALNARFAGFHQFLHGTERDAGGFGNRVAKRACG